MDEQKTSVQITAEVDGVENVNALGKSIQGIGDISAEAAAEEERLAAIVEASKKRQQMAAQELLAAEKKAVLESQQLQNLTAAVKREASSAQATEENRLAAIVEASKKRQQMAAQELLAAERKAYAEAEASSMRATAAREAEAKAVEDFSARTRKALADAFSVSGIRSTAAIQEDILQVDQALLKLASNARVSGADFDRAFEAGQARIAVLRAEMDGTGAASTKLARETKTLASEFSGLVAQLGGVYLAFQAGGMFVTANAQAETFSRTMTLLTGSSEKAAAEMDYVRSAANRLGLDVQDAAKSYTQLLAATKDTALEGDGARRVYEAVSGAMASLGKSSAETNNALMAVNQMASKGTVQMEELKGQLGDALPGALKAAANGAGLTVAELTEMIESGGVLAEDLLPALAKGLTEMYKTGTTENDTFVAQWARVKNSVTEVLVALGDTGTFKALADGAGLASKVIAELGVGFVAAGQKIGIMTAAVMNGDFGFSGFSDRAKQALGEVDAQTEKAFSKIAASGKVGASGLKEAGDAAEASGGQASAAAGGWLQIQNAYTQVKKASAKQIENLKVMQAARDSEAASMKAYADTYGTEKEKLDAASNAALEHEKALKAVSDQVRADLEIARAKLASLDLERNADGALTKDKEQLRETLQKTIEAKQAEADKTVQATAAAHAAANQAQASATIYADHAKQVYSLRDAYEAAEAEYQRLSALNATGLNVARELKAADEERAKALLLYRDALNDATAAAERNVTAERTAAGLKASQIENDKIRAETILEIARQRGNEKEIAQAQIAVWKIELQINEAQAEANRKDSEAILLVAKAKRAELEASDALTPAKKAELAVMEASAKAKQLEAEKYDLLAERMKALAYDTPVIATAFNDLSDATDRAASSADRASGSYDGLARSIKGAAAAKDGFSVDANGNIVNVAVTDSSTVASRFTGAGASEAEAKRLASRYFDAYGRVQNTGGRSLEEVVGELVQQIKSGSSPFAPSGGGAFSPAAQFHVSISGRTETIGVTDQQSAEALMNLLREGKFRVGS